MLRIFNGYDFPITINTRNTRGQDSAQIIVPPNSPAVADIGPEVQFIAQTGHGDPEVTPKAPRVLSEEEVLAMLGDSGLSEVEEPELDFFKAGETEFSDNLLRLDADTLGDGGFQGFAGSGGEDSLTGEASQDGSAEETISTNNDEAILTVLRNMLAEGNDLTQTGIPEMAALNNRLESLGIAPIKAADRDRLLGEIAGG